MMDGHKENDCIDDRDDFTENENQSMDCEPKSLQVFGSNESQKGEDTEIFFDADKFIEEACSLKSDHMPLLMAEQPPFSDNDSITDSPKSRSDDSKSRMLDDSVMASWQSESSSDSVCSINHEEDDKQTTSAEYESLFSDMEEFEAISSSNGNGESDINENEYANHQNEITYNLIDLDVPSEFVQNNTNLNEKNYLDKSEKNLCDLTTNNSMNKVSEEEPLDLLSNLSERINLTDNSDILLGRELNERNVSQSDDNLQNSKTDFLSNCETIIKELRNEFRVNSKKEIGNIKTKMKFEIVIENQNVNVNVNPSGISETKLVRTYNGKSINQNFNPPNTKKSESNNIETIPKERRDVEFIIRKSKNETEKMKTEMESEILVENEDQKMNDKSPYNCGTFHQETLNDKNAQPGIYSPESKKSGSNNNEILSEEVHGVNYITKKSKSETRKNKTKMESKALVENGDQKINNKSPDSCRTLHQETLKDRNAQPDFYSPDSEKRGSNNNEILPEEVRNVEYVTKISKSETGKNKTKMVLKTLVENEDQKINDKSPDNCGTLHQEIFNDRNVNHSDDSVPNTETKTPNNCEGMLDKIVDNSNDSKEESVNIKTNCVHCTDAEHGLAEVVIVKHCLNNFNHYQNATTCNNIKNTFVPSNAVGDSNPVPTEVKGFPQTTFIACTVTETENPSDPLDFNENVNAKKKEKLASKKSSANSAGDKLEEEVITTSPNKDEEIKQNTGESLLNANIAEGNDLETGTKDETLDSVVEDQPDTTAKAQNSKQTVDDGNYGEENSNEDGVSQIDSELVVKKVKFIEKVLSTEKDVNMKNEENEKFICFGIKKSEENVEHSLGATFPTDDPERKQSIKSKNLSTTQKKVTFDEESSKPEDDMHEGYLLETVEEENKQEPHVQQEASSDLDTALRFITESFPEHEEIDTLSDLLETDNDPLPVPKMDGPADKEIMEEFAEQMVTKETEQSIHRPNVVLNTVPETSSKKGEAKTKSKKLFPKCLKSFFMKEKKR